MRAFRLGTLAGLLLVQACAQGRSGSSSGTPAPGAVASVKSSTKSTKMVQPFVRRGNALRAVGNVNDFEVDQAGMHLILGESKERREARRKVLGTLRQTRTSAERAALKRSLAELSSEERDSVSDFSIRSLSVGRDGHDCIEGNPAIELDDDGGARQSYARCEERWDNRGNTAEQSYSFASMPTGEGALVVRVEAKFGAQLPTRVTSDPKGLRLASADGRVVSYGHGTWIEANGKRHSVPAQWAKGAIELRVPAEVLEQSQYPALLDPVVGVEVGTEAAALTPSYLGNYPEVASDGSGFLMAAEVNGQIRAVRADASGTPLDTDWLLLSDAATSANYYPEIAYGGGKYFITWWDSTNSVIAGRIVNPDGTVEGTVPVTLTTDNTTTSDIAWNGSQFAAVWVHYNDDDTTTIRLGLFDTSGASDTNAVKDVSPIGHYYDPRVTASDSQLFVGWYSNPSSSYISMYGARASLDGVAIDTTPLQLGAGEGSSVSEAGLDLASDGTNFLAVWMRTESSAWSVHGSLISSTGSLTAQDFVINRSTSNAGAASVDFDGTQYLVAWTDTRDSNAVYGAIVSNSGLVTGTSDVKLTAGQPASAGYYAEPPELAFNGTEHLLVYKSANSLGIQGALLSTTPSIVKDAIPMLPIPSSQGTCPVVGWDGSQYLLAFYDMRDSTSDPSVRVMRRDSTGAPIDTSSIVVSTDTSPGSWAQLLSKGDSSTWVFWSHLNGDYLRSLAANGTLGTLTSFTLPEGANHGRIGSSGTGYLVPYYTGDSTNGVLYGRLLDSAGVAAGSDFTIDATTANTSPVALGTSTGYLVAYSRSGTWVTPVGTDGTLGTATQLDSSVCAVQGASSSTQTLVVYDCPLVGTTLTGRFYENGTWGDAFEIATNIDGSSAVAWDGSTFWVVWDTSDSHLQSRNVASDGTMDAATTVVSDVASCPSLASDGNGDALLGYSKYIDGSSNYRVYSRLLSAGGTSGDPTTGGSSSGGSTGTSTTTTSGGTGNNTTNATSGGTESGAGGASSDGSSQGGAENATTTDDVTANGGASLASASSVVQGDVAEDSEGDSGCGCRVAESPDSTQAIGWLGALLALGLVRRRRA